MRSAFYPMMDFRRKPRTKDEIDAIDKENEAIKKARKEGRLILTGQALRRGRGHFMFANRRARRLQEIKKENKNGNNRSTQNP